MKDGTEPVIQKVLKEKKFLFQQELCIFWMFTIQFMVNAATKMRLVMMSAAG